MLNKKKWTLIVTTAIISATSSSFGVESSPTADNFKRDVQQRMSIQHETPEQAIKYVLTNLYQDQRTQLIANMQNDTTEIGQAFHQFITSQNSTTQSSSNAFSMFDYRLKMARKHNPKMTDKEAFVRTWNTFNEADRRVIKKHYALDNIDSTESEIVKSLPLQGVASDVNTNTQSQQATKNFKIGQLKNKHHTMDILGYAEPREDVRKRQIVEDTFNDAVSPNGETMLYREMLFPLLRGYAHDPQCPISESTRAKIKNFLDTHADVEMALKNARKNNASSQNLQVLRNILCDYSLPNNMREEIEKILKPIDPIHVIVMRFSRDKTYQTEDIPLLRQALQNQNLSNYWWSIGQILNDYDKKHLNN